MKLGNLLRWVTFGTVSLVLDRPLSGRTRVDLPVAARLLVRLYPHRLRLRPMLARWRVFDA